MDGGAPAGIKMPTAELECRITSTKIKITTRQGKRRTIPRGMEMLELPPRRSGRLKNASWDDTLDFASTSFAEGRSVLAEDPRFQTLCTKLMVSVVVACN
jgi:hypothetical protein